MAKLDKQFDSLMPSKEEIENLKNREKYEYEDEVDVSLNLKNQKNQRKMIYLRNWLNGCWQEMIFRLKNLIKSSKKNTRQVNVTYYDYDVIVHFRLLRKLKKQVKKSKKKKQVEDISQWSAQH